MTQDNPRVVTIHYTLNNDKGEQLDTSDGREPLSYLEGAGNIIPGLESALRSKGEGDALKVSIKPEDGYGHHNEDLVQQVPLEAFQGVEKVEAGMHFEAQTADGPQSVVITKVADGAATVDANHPLAGEMLHFEVKIVSTREPTAEELEHGHVHDGHGHHHHH